MKYYLAIRKDAIILLATIRMEMEGMMLREFSQKERGIYRTYISHM